MYIYYIYACVKSTIDDTSKINIKILSRFHSPDVFFIRFRCLETYYEVFM